MLDAACQMGLEGIVSKRRDCPYRAGKGDSWRKAKCRPDAEFVIGGWRQAPLSKFEAVLVGGYDAAGVLRYVGAIERGLSSEPALAGRLKAIQAEASPFVGAQPSGQRSSLHWVRPELVATVAFNQITDAGKLRQSSFKGLRPDRRPEEVRLPGRAGGPVADIREA